MSEHSTRATIRNRAIELFKMNIGMRVPGDKKSDTAFRKSVTETLASEFGTTVSSTAGAYAYAKAHWEKLDPEMVKDLGRPEGKKGGRRKAAPKANPAEVAEIEPAVQTEQV